MFPIQSTTDDKLYSDDVFSTYLYTGNGSTQTITNGIDLAGSGGMVWIKCRSNNIAHNLFDTVRGANKALLTHVTDAELTTTNRLNSFNSNGFTLGADPSGFVNNNGLTYASWTFRKAPKFFDVVTYTGNGADNRDIAHSLGTAPGMMIIKCVSTGYAWTIYHRSNGAGKDMAFDTSNVQATNYFPTDPTATTFRVNGSPGYRVNQNGETYVAYLFAHDTSTDGIIQCGSYVGNGLSAGPTITLGWEPQWLLIKQSSAGATGWVMYDTMRGMPVGTNEGPALFANTSAAEAFAGNSSISVTATGFVLNATTSANLNASGSTYIYLAIRRPNKPPTTGTQVYNAIARTGTGAAATVTGVGFAPDLVMVRNRVDVAYTSAVDRLRGAVKSLDTGDTVAERTANGTSQDVISFTMDGMSIGTDWNTSLNTSTKAIINHFFRRAPGFFDVVCYTGTGAAMTVAHGLGVAPELMIVKSRSNSFVWPVYHSGMGNNAYTALDRTNAILTPEPTAWNSTSPTNSVFSIGTYTAVNTSSATYVAYLFATCPGVSKVGSYTGNGSSQTINCGFAAGARFILIKRTDSTGDWYVWDSARGIVAANDPHLSLNTTAAEVTTDDSIDPDNSGFIVNQVAATNINVTSATYIYLAIA